MRVSLWKQDKSGAHWRRIGVIEIDMTRQPPFRVRVPMGEWKLERKWPRIVFHPMEVIEPPLFGLKVGAVR